MSLAWLGRGLLAGEVYGERDQLLLFLPLKRYLAERLRAFDLPDWWPWDGLGQPLASIPVASVFHPSTLGYLLLPFEAAAALQALLPFPVALAGVFLLGRTLGLRRPAAALGATLFACGFYFVALSEQTQMHLAAMSLPWAWREGLRVARVRRAPWWPLALAVANLVLGGDPMLLELAALTTLPLVLAQRPSPLGVVRVAAAAGLGLLLGAPQWVPMLFAWAESPRSAGLGVDTEDFWALRPPHLLGAVDPRAFRPETFLFETTYVGALALGLAALGLARPWRWRGVLLATVLGGGWLAVGRAGGLWAAFAAVVPGWSGFQFPAKALSVAVLALAVLAARGAHVALRSPRLGAAVLGGAGLLASPLGPWVGVALALGAAALLLPPPFLRRYAAGGLLVLLAVDQLVHGARIETRPLASLERPGAAEGLARAGVGLDTGRYVHAWNVPPYETRAEGLAHELASVRPDTGVPWGLPAAVPYLQGFTRRYFDVALADKGAWLSRRAALFATSAFVVNARTLRDPQRERVLFVDPTHDVVVLRASRSLPMAYVSFAPVPVLEAEAPARLGGPGFVFGRDVLVPADGRFVATGLPPPSAIEPIAPVTAVRRRGDDVELEVSLTRPGVLVWNEAFTEATTAEVDGTPTAVFPANHAVVGLVLETGTHRVLIRRTTPGLTEGLGLALLSLLGLALRRLRADQPTSAPM